MKSAPKLENDDGLRAAIAADCIMHGVRTVPDAMIRAIINRVEAETMERAAKIADGNRTDDDSMWDRAATTIATALRNAKDKP